MNPEFLNCDSNGECEEVSDVNKWIYDCCKEANKTITVGHLNIRSLKVNFDSLCVEIKNSVGLLDVLP
jgi:hypothetical protein